jgi:hypothetical protein
VLIDRPARIELLSLDGREDVLYELTEFDAEYVPTFGPQLGPIQHLETGFHPLPRPDDGHVVGGQNESEVRITMASPATISTVPRQTAAPANTTSLRVKTELLAELDATTASEATSGTTEHEATTTPATPNGETGGHKLYDPAHPTTEPTNATNQPSVDDLPPLLSAMVFRSSITKK